MRKYVLIVLLVSLVMGCRDNRRLNAALDFAGENRVELEQVLEHYRDSGLKYEAARFLIENMPRYYAYEGEIVDSVKRTLAKYKKQRRLSDEEIEWWGGRAYEQERKVYDAKVITADYLISNIDHAFEQWKKRPWNKSLPFEDFCNLLLPYRVMNEPLEDWRQLYAERYGYLLDSIYTGDDVIEAANVVASCLKNEGFLHFPKIRHPHLGASFLMEQRVGNCVDACDLGIYVFKALGIPITIDQYLYSPETRGGHTWTAVRDTTGRYVAFWVTEGLLYRDSVYSDLRKVGKIHRECFGARIKDLADIWADEQVPSKFKYPFLKDASADYFPDTLRLPATEKEYGKYAFLGVFHPTHWVAVDMARVQDGEAVFPHVEAKAVYVPMKYRDGQFEVTDYPFYFDGKRNIPYKPNLQVRDTVKLLRKSPLFVWTRYAFFDKVLGADVELSDSKNFENVKYRYHVTDTLCLAYNWLRLSESVKCRYARYKVASDQYVRLAEFQCWGSGKLQRPVSIGGSKAKETWGHENLLDNDPLTYYETNEQGDQLVMDYGREIEVDSILLAPQNDDNFIRIGDKYELFYHGGTEGWISLGRKKATNLWLTYNNMPRGALFHLRCLTRGKEELIFHIENGVQVFVSNLADPVVLRENPRK